MLRTVAFCWLAGSVLLSLARAAEPAQRLVRLNVSATDSKGQPVTDLTSADFQLREDGKVRPLAFFRFTGPKRTTLAARLNETGNHPNPVPTVILLDRWNENTLTAASAWVDIAAALEHAETVENMFIYFFTNHGDLYPVHRLPGPDTDLRSVPALTPQQLKAKLDDAVRTLSGFRSVDILDPIKKANTTLQILDALAGEMSVITGRKNLIWVTHGIPIGVRMPGGEWFDYTPQISSFSAGLSLAQIAIYPVEQSERGSGAAVGTLDEETLQKFASLTGGRWYPSDREAEAIDESIADGRAAYRIAFYSPLREKDKKEHKIRLEPARKGIRFLAREGYFGNEVEPDPDVLERALLTAGIHSPLDASEIGIRVETASAAAGKSHYAVRIDPADVLLEKNGDKYQGDLAVAFAFYSQGTFKSISGPVRLNFTLTEDQLQQARTGGLDLSRDIAPADGADKVRVLVFDRQLFSLGSVTLPVAR